jgi:ABC-type transport system substrate-binding protein
MRWIRTRHEALACACAAAAATLLTAPMTGCRQPLAAPFPAEHGDDAPPRPGGVLRVATYGDIRSLDPVSSYDGVSQTIMHMIFAGLVDYDEHAHLVGDLAERWEVDDGGLTYRFFLRPGVLMHDGQELVADDVKRSAERALHRATPNPNASYYSNIAGYEAYAAGKAPHLDGVAVEGRYVVSFHLKEVDATFLPILAMPPLRPVCKTAGDRYSDAWLPCGAGPFRLPAGGWQRGTSVRIERHDGYFRPGAPLLDAVEYTFNMQFVAQRFRFEDGQLDVLRDMTAADQARFAGDPRWAPLGAADAETRVYGESMNTRAPPFDNVEIRRAVAAAIDREHYVNLRPAQMTPLTQILPRSIPGYDPTVAGQRYDYAAALEHMRAAGYPYDPVTGQGGWPATIVYPLYDQGLLVYTAQVLQQELARIGLRLELKIVSWPTFLALQQRAGGAAMSQGNWMLDYPDPSAFFDPLFTTGAITPESSFNTAFYSNPRYDDLVARAHRELDAERRRALYHEANELLCADAPWAFVYAYHEYIVRQPYVRGFATNPVWSLDPSRIWIDRAGEALSRALGGGLR